MIFWSWVELAPGSIVTDSLLIDFQGVLRPPQPIYIVRAATREEWERDLREYGGIPSGTLYPYYYEVSLD